MKNLSTEAPDETTKQIAPATGAENLPPGPPSELSPYHQQEQFKLTLPREIAAAEAAFELPPETIITAPKTCACFRELIRRNEPGAAVGQGNKGIPIEVFSQYDPDGPEYSGINLQKEIGRMVPFRQETFEAVLAAGAGFVDNEPLISDEDLATMRGVQDQIDEILPKIRKFSPSAANAEVFDQNTRRVADTLKNKELPTITIRTRESIHAEYEANRRAFNELLMQLNYKTIPIAIAVYGRVLKIIALFMADLEHGEREHGKTYGVPFAPSYLWKACFALAVRFHPQRLLIAATGPAHPRDLIAGIVKL